MGHEEIQAVAESYSPQERQSLLGLAAEYRRRNEREVLELGALAADVSADDVLNLGPHAASSPRVLAANNTAIHNCSWRRLECSTQTFEA